MRFTNKAFVGSIGQLNRLFIENGFQLTLFDTGNDFMKFQDTYLSEDLEVEIIFNSKSQTFVIEVWKNLCTIDCKTIYKSVILDAPKKYHSVFYVDLYSNVELLLKKMEVLGNVKK